MQWFRLRPTFRIPLTESKQDAVQKMTSAYQDLPDRQLFQIFGDYGEMYLPPQEHRIWSPHLLFSIDQQSDQLGEHAFIYGRFAPRFEVWTFVWICYLAFGFTAFFGFILGFSQFMIGASSWGNLIGVIALVLWASLIVIAHVGQQLSADQMHALQVRLNEFLNRAKLHEYHDGSRVNGS